MNSLSETIILLCLVFKAMSGETDKFPDDFMFGVASAAYQVEGGFDTRGEAMFDYFQRLNPAMTADSSDAKIACDSYHRYEEDISLLKDLGVDFYRFSISWPRILPTGYPNQINPDGIRYYNNLINGLIAANIQPMVTINHYDLPKPLQDLGGWTNPFLAELFEDYSRILFKNFGDRVKLWVTINTNLWGYGSTEFPPFINQTGFAEYLCVKTNLLGHAKAYNLYQKQFKNEQKGLIGITIDARWFEPGSESFEDVEAAERAREFELGMWLNPIFEGDFPEVMRERIGELSRKEGFFKSRLPRFTQEERKQLNGAYDFFGLNHYTTYLVKDARGESASESGPSYVKDSGLIQYQDANWSAAKSSWLKVTPWGFRKVLKWVKERYGNPAIYITENGFSDDGELEDVTRIDYFKGFFKSLLEAIHEDGVQVKGYAAWSLLDNFEWMMGYTERFGLYHVDFTDPNRKRTPKSSSKWYKKLIERRQLDENTLKTEL